MNVWNVPFAHFSAFASSATTARFHTFIVDCRVPENPVPIATLPTPIGRDYCGNGIFGPHNLHEQAGFIPK